MPKKSSRPTFQVNLTQQELDKLHFVADSHGLPMTEVFRILLSREYRSVNKSIKKRAKSK